MKSIRSVYKVGNGPSSSHTVGPHNAAKYFGMLFPNADSYEATLYGSLAFTGYGHGTKKAIECGLRDVTVSFSTDTKNLPHPNTMVFKAIKGNEVIGERTVLSVGGGSILVLGEKDNEKDVYLQMSFSEMIHYCKKHGITLQEFVYMSEGEGIKGFLRGIWDSMQASVEAGIKASGTLPGKLKVNRKASSLFNGSYPNEDAETKNSRMISAYAFAVSEENADENIVVTAPTCGACGVIPAVLYFMQHDKGYPVEKIIDALAVAGLVGNVIRTNASISGAECGCQAEIGSACCMAAAAYATLEGLSLEQVEYAAEVAMEHNLGLTCDPVDGLVQIPCIERNAVAALRAINCATLSRFLTSTRKISFDDVIATMYQTGKDMDDRYKETAHGGLATMYANKQ